MAIKKSQIYSTLWSSCDLLRGAMDASQYKDYVLVLLFVKYISDRAKYDPTQIIPIPPGCYYDDLLALRNNPNIGEEINKRLMKIGEAYDLQGVMANADFNNADRLGRGKLLVDRVTKLLSIFDNKNLDFRRNRIADDDIMGDAYEYLMRNFATQSGKAKGQFYTPAEVSRVAAMLTGIGNDKRTQNLSIYDPACGSGSLLLRAKAEARGEVSLNGQEKDLTTVGMARMNMMLHNEEACEIYNDDTLLAPQNYVEEGGKKRLLQYDYILANPPFSLKKWQAENTAQDEFGRWGAIVDEDTKKILSDSGYPCPPQGCADYAFLLHIVACLAPGGSAACILPHGVLFRGGVEGEIRKRLVKQGLIRGIVGLPGNLFYGTGIPACIVVLHKPSLDETAADSIFMIDAKDGFKKDGSKNRLREQDIRRIADTWFNRLIEPHYSQKVSIAEIEQNDFNLNIPRYVTPRSTEIKQNLYAHLHGGIPMNEVHQVINSYGHVAIDTLASSLFGFANGYGHLQCKPEEVVKTIENDPSYQEQLFCFEKMIDNWKMSTIDDWAKHINQGSFDKEMIHRMGLKLLSLATNAGTLAKPYNLYDALMNYWQDVMLDDCYQICQEGYKIAAAAPLNDKGEERAKYKWDEIVCDLLPVRVVLKAYFPACDELQAIEEAKRCMEEAKQEMAELVESHPDAFDEDLLGGRVSAVSVKKVLRTAKLAGESIEYQSTWTKYAKLAEEINYQSDTLTETEDVLKEMLLYKYNSLNKNPEEVKILMLTDKWADDLTKLFREEMEAQKISLETDIQNIVARYEHPVSELEKEVAKYKKDVNALLKVIAKANNQEEEEA